MMTLVRNQPLAEEITQNTFYRAMTSKKTFAQRSGELTWLCSIAKHLAADHDLPEPYKEVFQLRVFGELPFSQIGFIFGKTENWARVTYHRARMKIQERMEKHG